MIIKAYKYRIYPTDDQKTFFSKTFGCCRWVYNYGLNKIKSAYENGDRISTRDVDKELTVLKKDEATEFLKDAPAIALCYALRNLDSAYQNFFRNVKKGSAPGYPKFKSKFGPQSFQFHQGYKINFEEGTMDMPKCPGVRAVFHRRFDGTPKTCTVSMTPSGKYYVSVLVETGQPVPEKMPTTEQGTIGVHFGIRNMATSKHGVIEETNRYLRDNLERLKVLQRRASKKKPGSQNRKKANLKVAKLHEKITNKRNYLLHQLSNRIVNDPAVDTIALENWDKREMMGDHVFAQAISDVSWGRAGEMIAYKAEFKGKNVIKIDKLAPSSKTCSKCGHVNEKLQLRHKEWDCSSCKQHHVREENAARNVEHMALAKVL